MALSAKTVNLSVFSRTCINFVMAGVFSFAGAAQSTADSSLVAAIGAGHYSEAVQIVDASLRSRPQDPWLWTMRGMALD